MYLKSICLAALCFLSPHLNASGLLKLTKRPLTINGCKQTETRNVLDLALANDGYFVVSNGKKKGDLEFTRFGNLILDEDYFIRTNTGEFLLGINKKSDPKKLSKLKISMSILPPKATSKVKSIINLPATAANDEQYSSSSVLYDSIAASHVLNVEYTKQSLSTWQVEVLVDDIKLSKGSLTFGADGQVIKQEGLSHIQWPTSYGLNDLKIDLSESTQYASPFALQAIKGNGYTLGHFLGVWISMSGRINLVYDNGQGKRLKHCIAIAKFSDPAYLERVEDHLYKPTEKSGPPRLHRENSQYAVLSGFLEQEPCLPSL